MRKQITYDCEYHCIECGATWSEVHDSLLKEDTMSPCPACYTINQPVALVRNEIHETKDTTFTQFVFWALTAIAAFVFVYALIGGL